MFHTYVASVLSRCCICFAMTFYVFSYVFANVSSVSSVYRRMLQNVLSGCFKSRSGVAHVAMARWLANSGLSQGFGSYSCDAPHPLLSLSSLPFPPSRLGISVGVGVVEGVAFGRRC